MGVLKRPRNHSEVCSRLWFPIAEMDPHPFPRVETTLPPTGKKSGSNVTHWQLRRRVALHDVILETRMRRASRPAMSASITGDQPLHNPMVIHEEGARPRNSMATGVEALRFATRRELPALREQLLRSAIRAKSRPPGRRPDCPKADVLPSRNLSQLRTRSASATMASRKARRTSSAARASAMKVTADTRRRSSARA